MNKPIALVAAMKEELDALLAVFPPHEECVHFNTPLYHACFENQDLVIAQSGVGKVNAACTLALLLSDFDPGCVINTGCAGGLHPHQQILDLVVPEQITYTDVDVTPLGFAFGQMMGSEPRFQASPALLKQFHAVVAEHAVPPTCHHGLLGSSDAFIYRQDQLDSIHRHFDNEVQCVDMEGGAIAHVCSRFGIPFLILRALSDVPCKGNNALDFQTFLNRASKNSAELCLRLVQQLSQRETL
jgi:adenosylhomocysteine nucleosidase